MLIWIISSSKSKQFAFGKALKMPLVLISFCITIITLLAFAFLPSLLNYSWHLVSIWMPGSVPVAALLFCVAIVSILAMNMSATLDTPGRQG
jgi:hypothetical protein